jgi:hypothetical protein
MKRRTVQPDDFAGHAIPYIRCDLLFLANPGKVYAGLARSYGIACRPKNIPR